MWEEYSERECVCALNRIFGFKPGKAIALIKALGSAKAVFKADKNGIDRVVGPFCREAALIRREELEKTRKELDGYDKKEYHFVTFEDDCYPSLLRECEDHPVGLYVRSKTPVSEIFNKKKSIAIVGTRDISPYGMEWCRKIVGMISKSSEKPLIVSGLALGTDITAQECALECGLPTVSVMATGIDDVYPYRHTGFALKTVGKTGCALVTDYPTATSPAAFNFLRRNRIIAGMCAATILVESKIRGGGMMTANLAFNYGRDVFTLPGRVDDPRSQGCNLLIRRQVASPITDLESLSESLGLSGNGSMESESLEEAVRRKYSVDPLREDIREITSAISTHKACSLDELCEMTGKPYQRIAEITNILECDGFIRIDLMQRCCVIKT